MKIFRIKKNRKASKINIFSNRFLINRIDPTSRNHNSSKAKLLTKAWTNDIFYCRVATWPTNVEIRVFPRSDEGVGNATRTGKGGRQGWKHGGVRREKYPCRIVLFFSFLSFFFFSDEIRPRWRGQRRTPHRKRHSGLELEQDLDVIF